MLFDRWIVPEVSRRESSGELEPNASFFGFQLIFRGQEEPQVRINEELIGRFTARPFPSQPVFEPGQNVSLDETMEEIVDWRIDTDEEDVGFVTLYVHRDGWKLFFNSLHNARSAKAHLRRAEEFLATAVDAIAAGRPAAATVTLYSAAELANKAFLLTFPTGVPEKENHKKIASDFFRLSRFHAFESVYTPCVKRLMDLRPKIRYLKDAQSPDLEELQNIAAVVEAFIVWVTEEFEDLDRRKLPKAPSGNPAP